MKADNSGPAFPQHGWTKDPEVLERMKNQGGMTMRQHFAGLAMQAGICTLTDPHNRKRVGKQCDDVPSAIAKVAVKFADALIAELNKTTEEKK